MLVTVVLVVSLVIIAVVVLTVVKSAVLKYPTIVIIANLVKFYVKVGRFGMVCNYRVKLVARSDYVSCVNLHSERVDLNSFIVVAQ